MKGKKKLLIALGIVMALVITFGIIAALAVKEYHDKNSWAVFEITGDGILEGQTIYECTPDVNVSEVNGIKYYGKGETILLGYASFTVERVDIGSNDGVLISSDNDLEFEDQVSHQVYLRRGESCTITSSEGSASITLISIGFQ